MEKAIYFILLLCGILSQGTSSLSEANEETSSDIQIRQKRVAGGMRLHRHDAPYLVAILSRGNYHAPASLLTENFAISSAHCFKTVDTSTMSIESRGRVRPFIHRITRLFFLDPNYNVTRPTFKNLALIKFDPPLFFRVSLNVPITIHSGSIVEERLMFHVVNWGKPYLNEGRVIPQHFRAIPVQLISIEYCQQVYPNLIGPGNICTSAMNFGQHGTDNDSGAPLLVDENLLGIMVYHGQGRATHPDVFMNLMDNEIRRWIHEHIPALHLF